MAKFDVVLSMEVHGSSPSKIRWIYRRELTGGHYGKLSWLVGGLVAMNFIVPLILGFCHHPNWRSPSFFRGVGILAHQAVGNRSGWSIESKSSTGSTEHCLTCNNVLQRFWHVLRFFFHRKTSKNGIVSGIETGTWQDFAMQYWVSFIESVGSIMFDKNSVVGFYWGFS